MCTLLITSLLALIASRYFYNRAISLFSLFMLNYFDFALRLIVLKDFLDSASYFSMSLIVVLDQIKMYRVQQLCLRVFIRIQDLLHLALMNQSL